MGEAVETRRRRRAAVDDQHAAAGLHAMKPALGQRRGAAAAAPGLGQHQIDQRAGFLPAAVEQRQAAVAMPHHPQRRRHALDRVRQDGRRLRLRGLQQRADFRQVLQRGQLRRRAAFGVAAVGQDLAADLLRQEAQRPGQEAGVFAQCDGGGDQAFQRGQRAGVEFLGRQRGGQAARIGDQPAHQPLAERVVGGGGEEIVMAEPGGDAGADDVGAVGDRVGRRVGDPFGHQRPRPQPRGVGAQRAQISQPGEPVRAGSQDGGAADLVPAALAQRLDARRRSPVRP